MVEKGSYKYFEAYPSGDIVLGIHALNPICSFEIHMQVESYEIFAFDKVEL